MNRVASTLLYVLAWIFRICAWVVCAITILSCFNLIYRFAPVASVLGVVQGATPGVLVGRLSLETPFGGLFRGDFAVVALCLFVLDWVCLRVSANLR